MAAEKTKIENLIENMPECQPGTLWQYLIRQHQTCHMGGQQRGLIPIVFTYTYFSL